jgi:glycosyltransferase involved in cell wall biosynthesis
MISVVILTKNEADQISKCLASVSWADEIIIVDDYSTDLTREHAKKALPKVKIYSRSLNGDFASQHNFGLEKATGEWVLFVDADEIISAALRNEILSQLETTPSDVSGFLFKRQDIFMNTKLAHGETSSWKSIRLARKGSGQWHRQVHEYWKISGRIMSLKNPIEHRSHETIFSLIRTLNFYTTIDAWHMHSVDHIKFQLFRVFTNPLGKFFQNYLLRLGFLDGFAGFIMAFMMSFNSLVVRVKIYDLEINRSNSNKNNS